MKVDAPKKNYHDLLSFWKNLEGSAAQKSHEHIRISANVQMNPVEKIDTNTEFLQGLVGKALQQYNRPNSCLEEGFLLIKGYPFLSKDEKKVITNAIDQGKDRPQAAWLKNRLENGYGFYGISDNGESSSSGVKKKQLQGLDHYNTELRNFKPLVNQNEDLDLEAFNGQVSKIIDKNSASAARDMARIITSYDLTVFQHLREAHQVFPTKKTEGGMRIAGDQTNLSDFVKLSILSSSTTKIAKKRIEFWIRVMKKLETIQPHSTHILSKRQGNLQSFCAVMGALFSSSISRLNAVWKEVDPKLVQYKDGLADFQHDLRDNLDHYMDKCMIPLYSSFNARVDTNNNIELVKHKIEVSAKISDDYKMISHLARNYWLPTYNKTLEICKLPDDTFEKEDYFWGLSDTIRRMSRIEKNGLFGLFKRTFGL